MSSSSPDAIEVALRFDVVFVDLGTGRGLTMILFGCAGVESGAGILASEEMAEIGERERVEDRVKGSEMSVMEVVDSEGRAVGGGRPEARGSDDTSVALSEEVGV